jgi:acetamidase/formamidase
MEHVLVGERSNVHGTWTGVYGVAPALTIDSGDAVEVRDIPDVGWGLQPPSDATSPRKKIEPRDPARDAGPCMVGPIAVRGAMPGDWLEIEFREITPGPWGFTYVGGSTGPTAWREAMAIAHEPLGVMRWEIDRAHKAIRSVETFGRSRVSARYRPFLGTVGVCPAAAKEPGGCCPWTPSSAGGNMDCRELIAGARLFLPVEVEGGLVSLGDGHAAQGDGEVAGTAIECMMERVRLRITRWRADGGPSMVDDAVLRPPMEWPREGQIRGPIAFLPDAVGPEGLDYTVEGHVATFGFGTTLDVASANAMRAMVEMIERNYHVDRRDALALGSARVSLRVTQIANPHKGVHAIFHA